MGLVKSTLQKRLLLLFSTALISGCVSSVQPISPVRPKEGTLGLSIQIQGLQCCQGVLRVGVYDEQGQWLDESGMIRGRVTRVLGSQQSVDIPGLPSGTYAVVVHQDLNLDALINKKFGFFPTEPYGFSNNVGKYGPVNFANASFELTESTDINIKMHKAR